ARLRPADTPDSTGRSGARDRTARPARARAPGSPAPRARSPGRSARPRPGAACRSRPRASGRSPGPASCTPRSAPAAGRAPAPSGRSRLLLGKGQQEPRPPEQVIVDGDAIPAVAESQRPHLLGAPFVDLDGQQPLRHHAGGCTGEQCPGRVEPIYPAHERLARLEVAYGRVERGVLRRGEVRRGRYDRPAAPGGQPGPGTPLPALAPPPGGD